MLIPDLFTRVPQCVPQRGILHVGAHTCEEEPLYHSIGIDDANILWIEGNKDLISPNKENIIHAVVSDIDFQQLDFIITNNMQSSSILNLKTHLIQHPHVYEIERRPVTTITLNTLFEKHDIPYDRYDFINLDIQGAELKALQGATKILPHINAIYTEINDQELYEGCAQTHQLDDFLHTYGFQRVLTSMTHHGWGDALYQRSPV